MHTTKQITHEDVAARVLEIAVPTLRSNADVEASKAQD
jgi:hypothetical protein